MGNEDAVSSASVHENSDAVTSASVHEDNAESATTTGAQEAVVVDAVSSASVK